MFVWRYREQSSDRNSRDYSNGRPGMRSLIECLVTHHLKMGINIRRIMSDKKGYMPVEHLCVLEGPIVAIPQACKIMI